MTTYHDYTEGHLTPVQALRALVMELGEVESDLQPLEEQRTQLREQIGNVLTRIDGEKAEIKGFGVVRLTQASIADKWDGKALAKLAERLTVEGHGEMARALLACKEKVMRVGGLRIERER